MRHHYFCFACLAGAISLLPALASAANDGADKWQPLFNGRDLTGWYTFITGHGRDKDPNGLIQVHDGMIHAYKDADNGTDQPIGYLCTNKEYSHYRLRFQYKWGKKRFAPRAETLRDAGLLYHATGPDGRWGGVWPLSVECQVQETDTGDLITVDTRCTAYIDPSTKRKENEYPVYVPVEEGGKAIKNTWYISADKVRDRLEGWNDVEVEVRGAKRAVHIVNGKVNQRLADIEQPTDDGWAPLEKGRIAFQIESAEVLYRNIEILPLASDRPSAEESEHDQPASPPPDAQSTTRGVDGLTVPDGFQIEVVAAFPLIRHPMMACLDDRGRLFVAESDGTNRESVAEILTDRPHQILMLEDTDADGRFDKSTVFAEGLIQANGAEWHDGALYVCSAPYVWRFRDLDGDGRADEQVRVAGKFNFDGMSSAFHGPAFGPDGRLYWSGGQHGWKLEQTLTKPDARAASGAGGPDADLDVPWTRTAPGAFASWPDGSDAESIGYGGIANPVEVAFTEEGEVLGTIALFDYLDSQRRDAVVHWIKGGVYNLKEHNYPGLIRTGEDLIPLSYRGHAAPSGITRYRGDSFGQDFRDNFFFTEFNTRKVYRLIVARDGATFRSRDEVFLASSNPDSHFTDVMEDPGGSLLIVDTGGWFLHGCPTSQIAKPNIYGAIYRIRRDDGRRVDDPRGQRLRWEEASNTELVSRFEDSRYAVRDRAIHELAKRQAVPVLGEALANGSPRERLLAVWSLNRICTPEARKAVRTALSDGDNSVRLAAIHSARLWRDKASAPRLIESLASDSPAVRRQAATALGSLKAVAAAPALLRAAELGGDRFLEHAITFALIEISDDAPIAEGLKSDSPTTCRLALIALDQRDSPLLTRKIVTALLDSPDKLLQKAALDVVRKRPQMVRRDSRTTGNVAQRARADEGASSIDSRHDSLVLERRGGATIGGGPTGCR